ncbi:MAG: spheroidene monooxygenase [bacterium]
MNESLTLISFFRFSGMHRLWGMKQMITTQNRLQGTEGLIFHKMLGTGGGLGYSFKPDFGTYALLTVWDKYERAAAFEADSEVMQDFRDKTFEVYSIFMQPVQSRGFWSNEQPFIPVQPDPENELIIVLTRATLKAGYYFDFWKRVSSVSRSHDGRPGLIFTKGVGERPWIMQATFSVWDSADNMKSFAFDPDGRHYEAIQTTRAKQGFKEELYARFQPRQTRGSWFGNDPVGLAMQQKGIK